MLCVWTIYWNDIFRQRKSCRVFMKDKAALWQMALSYEATCFTFHFYTDERKHISVTSAPKLHPVLWPEKHLHSLIYWISAVNIFLSLNSPSDGSGRTGTFCAVNIALERVKLDGTIDMFQSVRRLRTQRPLMVQTAVRRICVFLLLAASSVFHVAP